RPSGGKVELLFVRPLDGPLREARTWEALGRPGKALAPGARLVAPGGAELEVLERHAEVARVRARTPIWPLLERHGAVPLPPYIDRPAGASDAADYQTVFARDLGAVAAPTAALHFTDAILERLQARGVELAELTLHVGPGTFLPIRPD